MTDGLRIAHLRIAHQWAILRWAILTFTAGSHLFPDQCRCLRCKTNYTKLNKIQSWKYTKLQCWKVKSNECMGLVLPKHSVNYLVFQRDKGISRKSYKKLVRGAIRLPITFLWLNTMLKGKKQRKVALIMKLAISNFRCPGETHITNFTRLPLQYILSCLFWVL